MHARRTVTVGISLAGTLLVSACASAPVLNEFGNPPKLAPTPTSAPISAADLRTRLYIFADDSMQGRQFGRVGNMKGTEYIARELARLGVEPAGDNGTYFQDLPVFVRKFATTSTLSIKGHALKWVDEWIPVPGARPREVNGAQVIFGGTANDTVNFISAAQATGKIVLVRPASAQNPATVASAPQGAQQVAQAYARRVAGAVAIVNVNLDVVTRREQRQFLAEDPPGALVTTPDQLSPTATAAPAAGPPAAQIRITRSAAEALLGGSIDNAKPGQDLGVATAKLDYTETPAGKWARNVVGIIRGSDAKLKNSYVAVGAHPDHVGYDRNPVDHDSLKFWLAARQAIMNKGGDLHAATPAELAAIKLPPLDSIRKVRPARADSIRNGADDDGSGAMALLEIAESVTAMEVKPKRSLLLVWHNGEEAGLLGSQWYTMHTTVPRDSIIVQINMDQIGRGRVADVPGGGDDYLSVIGSQRLSNDLGREVVAVNLKQPAPFRIDYRFDSTTTWPGYNNIYGRSDHYNYARFNIPIAFFSTLLHADYHQVTDEAQDIDYPHLARVAQYVSDVVVALANRDQRLALNKP